MTPVALHAQVPRPDHILIVFEENRSYSEIIGSTAAPYINSLAADSNGAVFTQSMALTHPSQPNYIMLFSGSNQGVTDDNLPANLPFATPNLGAALLASGLSFAGYSEDLPYVGFTGEYSGTYARKHNPWVNWQGASANAVPSVSNQPLTNLPSVYSQLPTVLFVIPNTTDDMHDGPDPQAITTADTWLKTTLDGYIQWAKSHNSLFILTFDEDDGSVPNHIPTLFVGQMVKHGQYTEYIDHYNVLRTLEEMYSLPYAGNSSTSSSIKDCWLNASITISGSAGIAGATLSYTDTTAKTATADGTGSYSFTVSYNWSGTVTPSKAGYTFSPTSRTYTNVLTNQTAQNYTPTAVTYTIAGSAGVAGATLSFTDTTAKTATADGAGSYSFAVSYNWSGTVTPSKTGYAFSPASRPYTNVLANQTGQNYAEYVVANMKVFLQGPFSGGAMTTTLDTSGFIPHTSDSAYAAAIYGYTASTVSSIPSASVVDWLLVELRSDTSGATKVAGRAGFLESDGTVVDTDGVGALRFTGVLPGNYYIVVRHRNHLSIMSAVAVAVSSTSALYDFTTAQTQAYGTNAMAALTGGVFGMIAGDVNQDGIVKYNLGSNDRALIYIRIGSGNVNLTVRGYYPEDVNLDGIVKYNLPANDRGTLFVNIGGTSVNATVSSKVPK